MLRFEMKEVPLTIFLICTALLLGAANPIDIAGDSDPAVPCRVARAMTFGEIKRSMYEGSRPVQLNAIDAADCHEATFDLLPYLAALMGARDRQVAARAAFALRNQIKRALEKPTGFSEVIEAQASALIDQLINVGKDSRLDLDIRIAALETITRLKGALPIEQDFSFLLDDGDPQIRGVVLSGVAVPLDKACLSRVAGMVTEEDDPDLRGRAVAILCENALAHGVAEPSADLKKILKSALEAGDMKAQSVGSILGCLKRFPVEIRGDFVDQALSHPDPAVAEFWKSLE